MSNVGSLDRAELAVRQFQLVGWVYGNSRGVNGQSTGYYENLKRINVSMAEAKGRVEGGEGINAVPLAQLHGLPAWWTSTYSIW